MLLSAGLKSLCSLYVFVFLEEVFERWGSIPADTKREAGERMKVCAFWLPILLEPEESSNIASWAVHIGLISHK